MSGAADSGKQQLSLVDAAVGLSPALHTRGIHRSTPDEAVDQHMLSDERPP